jgi:tetratricopeptide (TPR) repeat protein
MTRTPRRTLVGRLIASALTALTIASTAAAQDSLAAARDLYASAAYEDALASLNRLRSVDRSADEARAIEQYRAFCLLALRRPEEAERAIEAVVAAQPTYHPSEAEVSPRVRSAFSDVRRRMLPAIIQDGYTQSKASFDRKEFAAAAAGFKLVLDVLADPDIGTAATASPLSDLRTLASGFYELSEKAAAPPPPPPPPPPVPQPEPAPPPKPSAPRVYGSEDANVTPPVAVRQAFPPYPGSIAAPRQGVVEVIVDETGAVESAMLTVPVNAAYDNIALAAARSWLYKPATLNGVPVKYRKAIQIVLKPAAVTSR